MFRIFSLESTVCCKTVSLFLRDFRLITTSFHTYLLMMRCAIWYHLYNLKNVKNTHWRVLILVKLQASACNLTIINTPPWVFFTFFKLYIMVPNRATHHTYELTNLLTNYWLTHLFVWIFLIENIRRPIETNMDKYAKPEMGTQLTFTCSKSKTETIEKGVKYVQSWQWKNMTSKTLAQVFSCKFLEISKITEHLWWLLLSLDFVVFFVIASRLP